MNADTAEIGFRALMRFDASQAPSSRAARTPAAGRRKGQGVGAPTKEKAYQFVPLTVVLAPTLEANAP
jgi:hypothetical protein